jgi:hypothetical protein
VSLNVKNPRAYELATQLSEITGESLTDTVIRSLETRLAQERRRLLGETTAKRILAFGERFAPGMKTEAHSAGHADLYGEDGLPR